MGIPRFVSWLKDVNFPNVLQREQPANISSLSLDVNGLLHYCAQYIYAYNKEVFKTEQEYWNRKDYVEKTPAIKLEAEFLYMLASEMVKILAGIQPQDVLVIAVDGVAPSAKINQQRKRRFKSAFDSTAAVSKFDSNAITPGTDFMVKVDLFFQEWISANKMTRMGEAPLLPNTVIYSSHMEPGEGEHKIMNLIRAGYMKGDGAHIIYGLDADLIMLSLLAPINNIYLMRQDVHDIVNIESLKFNLQQDLNPQTGVPDFVFMSFFIGNDFLPHLLTHLDLPRAFNMMFKIHRENKLNLIVNGKPYWPSIKKFLIALSMEEPNMLTLEARREILNPLPILTDSLQTQQIVKEKTAFSISSMVVYEHSFNMDKFRNLWYHKVFDAKKPEKTLQLPTFTNDDIYDMAYKYIVGLHWIFTYYTNGIYGINLDYTYNYHYPPLLADIATLASQLLIVNDYTPVAKQEPLNPIYQLLAVLPLKSKSLVPKRVQPLMSDDSILSDLYPTSALVDKEGTDVDYRGIILIPFANTTRIVKAARPMVTKEELQRFTPTTTLIIRRSTEESEKIRMETNLQKTINLEREYRRKQHRSSPSYKQNPSEKRETYRGPYRGAHAVPYKGAHAGPYKGAHAGAHAVKSKYRTER